MCFPVAVLRVRAKLFQCQYVGIDLPFTCNYSSCGDGHWSPLYCGDTGGTSPPCAFAGQGFHTTLENDAAETERPISFPPAKAGAMPMGADRGCWRWWDPGCSWVTWRSPAFPENVFRGLVLG